MPKEKRLEQELGLLKLFFGIFAVVNASVIGWLAQNFRKAETMVLTGGLIVMFGLGILLTALIFRAYKLLDRLEET